MIHIGIIWANPYSRNLGVGALAYSTLAILNDVCKENSITADFSFVGSSGKRLDNMLINGNEIKFSNIKGNDHLKWKSFFRLALFPRKYNTHKILQLDIVFDISEGDSFTDIYGDTRYEKFLNSKRFFNLLRTHQVLLPQTIGPFNSPDNEKKAFNVMRKLDMVISRDKQSLEYTSRFLPEHQVMETIDVAFYMGYKKRQFNGGNIHVGINISGLLWNGGYNRKNQFDLKSDYRRLIQNSVDYFLKIPNVKIHFISHVISKRKWVEDDFTIAEEFHKAYPDTVLAPEFTSPVEAKSYISGLDFFFGSRMHACIAAFSSGVPVFPMAYSRKFDGLFRETLTYKWLGDCINETDELIFTNLKHTFDKRDEIRTEIDNLNKSIVAVRLTSLKEQILKSILYGKINHQKN